MSHTGVWSKIIPANMCKKVFRPNFSSIHNVESVELELVNKMKMRRQKVRAEVEASLCMFRNGDGRVIQCQILGNYHLGLK